MILNYVVDVVIFVCAWVVLFVLLSPRVLSMSETFVNIQSAIDHAENYYSFCPIGLKEKYKEDIKKFTQEKWRVYKRIAYPLAVVCVVLAFVVTYIAHTLLWGAK